MTDWNKEIKDWTDEKLEQEIAICLAEVEKAHTSEPNGDWHQSCFAAWYMMAQEMVARSHLKALLNLNPKSKSFIQ